jgi:DNA-binding response OmpR family regulator
MKIIVYGDQPAAARITSLLNTGNIEVIEAAVTDTSEPVESFFGESIDLIVVEGDEEDVTNLCRSLREGLGEIPVVIAVNKNRTDWTRLISADADGYLYMEDSSQEMKARIKAILRSSVPGVS